MQALVNFFGFGGAGQVTSELTIPAAKAVSRSRADVILRSAKVKTAEVDVSKATRKSSPSRPKVIIPVKLKRGVLSGYGYHADRTVRSRHIALLRASRDEGFSPIIKRLTLIATFTRYRSPRYSRIFKLDQEWLSNYYRAINKAEERANLPSREVSRPRTRKAAAAPSQVVSQSSKITTKASPVNRLASHSRGMTNVASPTRAAVGGKIKSRAPPIARGMRAVLTPIDDDYFDEDDTDYQNFDKEIFSPAKESSSHTWSAQDAEDVDEDDTDDDDDDDTTTDEDDTDEDDTTTDEDSDTTTEDEDDDDQ